MNVSDLKKRKKALKLTTKELAYMAELPVSTVSKIMTGETKNPSYLTVDILDKTLLREEAERRTRAYLNAMETYIAEHPDEEFEPEDFEKQYRADHNLDDAPIPYAVPKDSDYPQSGNLAYDRDNGLMNIDEYCKLGESRNYELLDGHLIVNENPKVRHNRVVQKVWLSIYRYIEEHGGPCEAFMPSINTRFAGDDMTCLGPDIVVVCDPDNVDDFGTIDAPDWIIEVTSKSTRGRDYNEKRRKYMECGVREYWIIDIQKDKVVVYLKEEPEVAHAYSFDDRIPVSIYNGEHVICVNELV